MKESLDVPQAGSYQSIYYNEKRSLLICPNFDKKIEGIDIRSGRKVMSYTFSDRILNTVASENYMGYVINNKGLCVIEKDIFSTSGYYQPNKIHPTFIPNCFSLCEEDNSIAIGSIDGQTLLINGNKPNSKFEFALEKNDGYICDTVDAV